MRDTMAFELQAADALRTKQALEAIGKKHSEREAAMNAEVRALRAETEAAKQVAAEQQRQVEDTTPRGRWERRCARSSSACECVRRTRRLSSAALSSTRRCIVSGACGHPSHRCSCARQAARFYSSSWRSSSSAACTRGYRPSSRRRSPSHASRTSRRAPSSTKAQALEQLRAGHELATDKELLREQSRALQAAHESAAAAHLVAAAHRVGEQVLGEDLRSAEAVASEASAA